jgi:hypothetical protein
MAIKTFKQRIAAVKREKDLGIPHGLWAEWCVLNDYIFECGRRAFKYGWTSKENIHYIGEWAVDVMICNNNWLQIRVRDTVSDDTIMELRWMGEEYLAETLQSVMFIIIPHFTAHKRQGKVTVQPQG